MKGHGQKLTRKKDMAILALLSEPTYARAAAKVHISESTLHRWLQLPEFLAAYRAARSRMVESGIATFQRLVTNAVVALGKNLTCGHPASENRAAIAIVSFSLRGVETMDLETRLAEVEERVKEQGEGANP
jgi:uncharacterized protein (UPF0254 family)